MPHSSNLPLVTVKQAPMRNELLCTLGPASLNARTIKRLEEAGVSLFRINLSHTALGTLEETIRLIRSLTDVPICLDTEGAQVRTGPLVEGTVMLRDNSIVTAHSRRVPGDSVNFSLYPSTIVDLLQPGDFVSIDFHAVLTQVIQVAGGCAIMRVINGGEIGQNKAVTVHRALPMAPLTEKDTAALAIGRREGIEHVALSFANRAADVDELRRHVGPDTFVISKIECRAALENLDDIIAASNAILIDRGDLSREIPIERIPPTQKMIIGAAKRQGRKVYVATNLLESMVTSPNPTRAEINDIFNTLADGADGLVLAAETAIGSFPIRCANMVVKVVREFEPAIRDSWRLPVDGFSMLIPPHGGRLTVAETMPAESGVNLFQLRCSLRDLRACEQIAFGFYSPITGFMGHDDLVAVLKAYTLADGTPWPLPIVLPVGCDAARRLEIGQRVALTTPDGQAHSVLDISEIYHPDKETVARLWFGSGSSDPGVAWLGQASDHFVAGKVSLVKRLDSPYRAYELVPAQTRFIFAHKGWGRIVGFRSHTIANRGNEYIQLTALERAHADGLFVSPALSEAKPGDFSPGVIVRSYEAMLEFGVYPRGKVVLGAAFAVPGFHSLREAVLTAICHKNMGCSHFVFDTHRGSTGTDPADVRQACDLIGSVGIQPLIFDRMGYDATEGRYVPMTEFPNARSIEGFPVEDALRKNERIPDWLLREVVQDALREELAAGRSLFQS